MKPQRQSALNVATALPPGDPGTYALVLKASRNQKIPVGRLGRLIVQPGFYVYVGSALGPGGIASRVSRHYRLDKSLRWHIDYLRAVTELDQAWYAIGDTRRECDWAAAVSRIRGAKVPLEGFGASDCRCKSHLFQFCRGPNLRAILRSWAAQINPIPIRD
jgi:Uri superfamily endonuclease